jgi:hypothetical protein
MKISFLNREIGIRFFFVFLADIALFWFIFSGSALEISKTYYWFPTIIAIIFCICAYYSFKDGDHYLKGFLGEVDVKLIFDKFPKEYTYIRDLELTTRGNVDGVLVGPTGIWSIEVKNISGLITSSGDRLFVRYRESKHQIQAYAESKAVEEYLYKVLQKQYSVQPVLVYSHKFSFVKIGRHKVKGVCVIGARWLKKLIIESNLNQTITQNDQIAIISALKQAKM